MRRIALVMIGAVILSAVVFLAVRGSRGPEPFLVGVWPYHADDLWKECLDGKFLYDKTDPIGHRKLHLSVAKDLHSKKFKDYFLARPILVGMVRNEETASGNDAVGDGLKTMPPGVSCIFMGGDDDGLFARIVWNSLTMGPIGETRRVAARFDPDNAHPRDDAIWDNPVDKNAMEINLEELPVSARPDSLEGGAMKAVAGEETRSDSLSASGAGRADRALAFNLIGFELRKADRLSDVLAGLLGQNTGAWFTCSEYTCCKAK